MILTPIASAIRSPIRSPFDPRRSGASGPVNSATAWYFASLGLAGTPWADVSRTGLGTRINAQGLVELGMGLGPELLTNGDGSTTAGWVYSGGSGGGVTSVGGQLVFTSASSLTALADRLCRTEITGLTVGRTYRVSCQLRNISDSVGARISVAPTALASDTSGTYADVTATSLTSIQFDFVAANTVIFLRLIALAGTSLGQVGADNISVRAISLAPRITHDPALDVNGNPYTVTEQYGPELVTNGDFQATLAGWTAGNGNISGVVTSGEAILTANGSGSGGYIQDVAVTPGRTYRFRIKARKISGPDAVRVQIWDGASFTTVLSQLFDLTTAAPLEARTIYVRPATSTLRIYLFCATSCVGGFDDASITEYLGTVTAGTPRPLGLLVEGQGTEIGGLTDRFDDAGWSKINATVLANAAVAPDGTLTAEKLVADAVLGQHRVNRATTIPAVAHVFSVHVKAAEYGFVWLRIGSVGAVFNLATGATTVVDSGVTTRATRHSNGWWRLSIACVAVANAVVRINAEPAEVPADYAGNGASGILIWGAQLETGSIATSYIPNPGTGSAVRAADDWFLSGAAVDAALGAARNNFTIYVEWFEPAGTLVGNPRVMYLGTTDFSRRVDVYRNGSGVTVFVADGVVSTTIAQSPANAGAVNKLAISADGTNVRLVLNGSAGATLASAFGGAAMAARLLLLHAPGTSWMNTYVPAARAFPGRAMSIAEMQALTA